MKASNTHKNLQGIDRDLAVFLLNGRVPPNQLPTTPNESERPEGIKVTTEKNETV